MGERRVLIVEPFLHGSHHAWADGWRGASRHEVHVIGSTEGRWRRGMRVGAVPLAAETDAWVAAGRPPDLIVGTNMLDLAGYLGLARRSIGAVPAVQFMHENQLTYPRPPGEALDAGLAWMQWRGLVAADEIWFNSEHHRQALLAGIDELDHEPGSPVDVAAIEAATWVAHVGVAVGDCRRATPAAGTRRPLVVSNQRWHHDKDLGSVLRALRTARRRGLAFDVALLGDPTGGEGDDLAPLVTDLGDSIVVRGRLERSAYLDVLRRADVVVSAARNENFGIAIVEAVAAGAWPIVPDALAYPEVIEPRFHGDCLYEPGGLGARLRDVLTRIAIDGEPTPAGLADSMDRYDWSVIAPALDDRVDELLDRAGSV